MISFSDWLHDFPTAFQILASSATKHQSKNLIYEKKTLKNEKPVEQKESEKHFESREVGSVKSICQLMIALAYHITL